MNDARCTRFIADSMLGRLAKWLRVLGFDTLYKPDCKKEDMILRSLREKRVILTRNTRLSKSVGLQVVFLADTEVKNQISQIINELNLKIDKSSIFIRCTICNEIALTVPKEQVKDKVPEYVYNTQKEFRICPACKRIYWAGTHSESVARMLAEINIC